MKKRLMILTLIKYLYFLFLIIQGSVMLHSPLLFICGFIELLSIFLLSGLVTNVNKIFGQLLNIVFLLIYGIELIVLRYGGGYISVIMVTNLDSIQGISGKLWQYIVYAVLLLCVLLIPTMPIKLEKGKKYVKTLIAVFIMLEIISCISTNLSPIKNSIVLAESLWKRHEIYMRIAKSGNNDIDGLNTSFYKSSVGDYVSGPFNEEHPDIVLIFTEGLSQSIIDDNRGIMPNVKKYQNQSINFINYYNHTAATYRGIIGQLYSGHQYNNNDENKLISLQSILKDNGYQTTFINTEPNNKDFTNYLLSMDFDEIITEGKDTWLTDKRAYKLLADTIRNKQASKKPQFIVIYTFGTHATFDNTDYKYGDGRSGILNRFCNADHYFSEFMNTIENEQLNKNLAIIFTSDHCTYEDEDFIKTFEPAYERKDYFCDKIPFFIWYNGVKSKDIDVKGRNSLCMAPTLLDFFDMDGENYFLGDSLFSKNDNSNLIDKVYSIPDNEYYRYTTIDSIRELTETERNQVVPKIINYMSYTIKAKEIVY